MASHVTPKKNAQYITYIGLPDQADTKLFKSNTTIAAGDFKVSTDGGALGNLGTLPTVTPAGGKMVKITLSAGEMNGDNITLVCSDAAGAEWADVILNIQTSANQIDDLAKPGDNMNLADDAITAAKYDESTAFPVKSADTGATEIARTGADGDTLETLSDQIDTLQPAANYPTNFGVLAIDESGIVESNLKEINGNSVVGNLATLTLKQLDIQNSAGSAIIAKSTGGNGNGIEVEGNGTGIGLKVTGGATGSGVEVKGGATSGKGMLIQAVNGDSIGLDVQGSGDSSALRCIGGSDSGHGIQASGQANGHGIFASAGAGSTAHGIIAVGGGTSGSGIYATAGGGDNNGFTAAGSGSGKDISAKEIGTPVALDGGTASLAGMLTKMADDNGGADFNAGTDSLHELSTETSLIESTVNGIDTTVNAIETDTQDIQTKIGTPVALDGGAATLGGMLTKMADDNGGADFDATTDTLEKISAAVGGISGGDWTANEKTEIKTVLGITDTGTPDSTPSDGALKNIQDRLPAALVSGRMDAQTSAYDASLDFTLTQKQSIEARCEIAITDTGIDGMVAIVGQATAQTQTTLTDTVNLASVDFTDDYFNDMAIVFTSGPNRGQSTPITDFDDTTDTLTFADVWPNTFTGTDKYIIVPKIYVENIATAIDANVVSIDGQLTSGNNATLNLKQLNVVNSAGDAVVFQSTGGNGEGLFIEGHGTGDGVKIHAGLTSGYGIRVISDQGVGAYLQGGNGAGLRALSVGGAGGGIEASGNGGSAGIEAVGGATGAGMEITGQGSGHGLKVTAGASGGEGLNVVSAGGVGARFQGGGGSGLYALSTGGDGKGINAVGNGSGDGISATAGATGNGVNITGGSSSGDGVYVSTTAGNGITVIGTGGNGIDVSGDGAAAVLIAGTGSANGLQCLGGSSSGHGIWAYSLNSGDHGIYGQGAGSGHGLYCKSQTSGNGIHAQGAGAGAGIYTKGGTSAPGGAGLEAVGGSADGSGIQADGNGAGHGIQTTGGATGAGLRAIGGATSGNGVYVSATAGNNSGILTYGKGTGAGLTATGGGEGPGARFAGGLGSTGGAGIEIEATGTGDHAGVDIEGQNAGHGIKVTAGSSGGEGLNVIAGAGAVGARFQGGSSGLFVLGTDAGSKGLTASGVSKDIDAKEIPHSIKKNTAIAGLKFVMVDATTGNPAAGFTVTASRKLDADATWSAMPGSGTIVDNGSGVYSIDIAAADTNGDTGVWRFTAPGAETTLITFVTELA